MVGRIILITLLMLLVVVVPVYAISNPDSINIGDVYAFEDALETGDVLVFVRYDVSYASQPTEDSEDTFVMAIYDTDGTTLLFTRPLNYYQHNIISIYLSAALNTLTSGGAYYVRIMGSPALFSLAENVNMDTRVLSSGDWRVAADLGGVMIAQAGILAADWGLDLLTSTDRLNSTGSTYFSKAVPGLSTMVPTIFATTTAQFTYTRDNFTNEGLARTKANMPVSLNSALNGLNTVFGVESESSVWGQFGWLMIAGMVVGSVVYGASRRPDIAVFGGVLSTVGLGAYLGVANGNAMLFLMSVGALIIALFGITYILPKYG